MMFGLRYILFVFTISFLYGCWWDFQINQRQPLIIVNLGCASIVTIITLGIMYFITWMSPKP